MKVCLPYLPLCCAMLLAIGPALASDGHHHGDPAAAVAPPAFVASTAKPFAGLMADAMAVMDDGMRRAPMNGQPEHDFVTMMIPHHQGSIDMAKALLLTTRDPALRNMAQGVIAEQQVEIQLLRQWLLQHLATSTIQKATP
jgi:hypothetical protein